VRERVVLGDDTGDTFRTKIIHIIISSAWPDLMGPLPGLTLYTLIPLPGRAATVGAPWGSSAGAGGTG
jgi:hypothetical protein